MEQFDSIERRLQQAVTRPAAPPAVHAYIDGLTFTDTSALTRERLRLRPRHLGLALAAAAAAIVAIVASSMVVSIRNSTPGAGPGGWIWHEAQRSLPAGARALGGIRVARGYLATCPVVTSASQVSQLCTSPDGVRWSAPPDAAIAGGIDSDYLSGDLAEHSGTYLTVAFDPGLLWRSTDGEHWAKVPAFYLPGEAPGAVAATENGFIALIRGVGEEDDMFFTSPDGLAWTKVATIPVGTSTFVAPTPIGLAIGQKVNPDGSVISVARGAAPWDRVSLPAMPSTGLIGAVRLGTGPYFATLLTDPMRLIESSDGINWRFATAPPGEFAGMIAVGHRLVVTTVGDRVGESLVWQSLDGGKTWSQIVDAAGRPLTHGATCLGYGPNGTCPDGLVAPTGHGEEVWVLRPAGSGSGR